jgi:choline monooxygenase
MTSATTTSSSVAPGPLDDRPVGVSILPAASYTDPGEFEREQQRIFAAGWVWAGFEHWIPEAGDARPVTIAGRPLLLVRDRDGAVRVFHNVCRHRGMQLVEAPVQAQRRLRCAYHCWAYSLSGELELTPFYGREGRAEPSDSERAQLSLLPVASACWAGMILVNLSEDPDDVDELLAPLRRRWDWVDFSRLHLAGERRYDIDGNWKLAVENFLDFYHLPFIHPQIGPASVTLDVDDLPLAPKIIGGSYPRGAEAKADKTDLPLPHLGPIDSALAGRQDLFCIFPNALVFLEAGWLQVIGVFPVAPDSTIEHMALFVDRDASAEEFDGSRKLLCDSLYEINEQDLPILRKLQQGRYSPAADRNHLVPHWDQVTAHFQQQVHDSVGSGS